MAGLYKCDSCRRIVRVIYEGKGEEEAKHKLRLETIYDEQILSEN